MKKSILSVALLATLFACEKDEKDVTNPDDGHEEELITTVNVEVTEPITTISATYSFQDVDGPGGNDPTKLDTITLVENTSYNVSLSFLNESEDPAENITEEISEEADEHFICFDSSDDKITVTRTDSDGTYELGLESTWAAGSVSTNGTITITLKHQDEGKDGTCTPGETDVEVTFPVKVVSSEIEVMQL